MNRNKILLKDSLKSEMCFGRDANGFIIGTYTPSKYFHRSLLSCIEPGCRSATETEMRTQTPPCRSPPLVLSASAFMRGCPTGTGSGSGSGLREGRDTGTPGRPPRAAPAAAPRRAARRQHCPPSAAARPGEPPQRARPRLPSAPGVALSRWEGGRGPRLRALHRLIS